MIELKSGEYVAENEALTALAMEAQRQGISYGNLVAKTSGYEREKIICAYCAQKRKKARKRGNGR